MHWLIVFCSCVLCVSCVFCLFASSSSRSFVCLLLCGFVVVKLVKFLFFAVF